MDWGPPCDPRFGIGRGNRPEYADNALKTLVAEEGLEPPTRGL